MELNNNKCSRDDRHRNNYITTQDEWQTVVNYSYPSTSTCALFELNSPVPGWRQLVELNDFLYFCTLIVSKDISHFLSQQTTTIWLLRGWVTIVFSVFCLFIVVIGSYEDVYILVWKQFEKYSWMIISITVKFIQELDIIAYLFNDPTSDGCINPKNLQLEYWTGVLKVVTPEKSHHHLHVLCPSLKMQIREDAIILLKWLSIFMFLSTYKTLIFIRKHNLSSLWYLWL